MDNYNILAFQSNLYSEAIITTFASIRPNWNLMSNREKELMLLKITCNVFLCNMEMMGQSEIGRGRKRKLLEEMDTLIETTKKKKERTHSEASGSTKETEAETSKSGACSTSGSTWSSNEIEEEEAVEKEYRCIMAKYMPVPEIIINEFSNKWKLERGDMIWDIIDKKEKKFIKTYVGSDTNKMMLMYNQVSIFNSPNCSACFINPSTAEIMWRDHPGDLVGISKVITFLIKRKTIIQNLGIIDTEIQLSPNISKDIFMSKWFNGGVTKWMNDWNKEAFIKWPMENLYTETASPPSTIAPKQLLDLLDNPLERVESETVKFRGKLIPEGWNHNIVGNWNKDNEMVEEVIKVIEESLSTAFSVKNLCEKQGTIDIVSFLRETCENWSNSKKNTFLQMTPSYDKETETTKLMGIGKRKRTFNPLGKDMKQKEMEPIRKCKYDYIYDEIIRRLNMCFTNPNKTEYTFPNLLETPNNLEHPLASVCEKGTTSILKKILQTNASLLSSKYTNVFSRIGGAYHGGHKLHNTIRKSISIFPIVANTGDPEQGSVSKYISGVILRGPNHTKNPTDRIPIITIELLRPSEDTDNLMNILNKGYVLQTESIAVLVRSNSVMKEDTSYLTFTNTALFNPLNMLGVLTMENPDVPPNHDLESAIENEMGEDGKWLIERFTEGIMMATIGNSRDEGYFACLRKIAMVLFSWRNNDAVANWDIESFCKKTNECLLDNPLSMHFHMNILDIIREYL